MPEASTEQQVIEPVPVPAEQHDSRLVGVRGWLLFFIVTLVFVNPLVSLGLQAFGLIQLAPLFGRFPRLLPVLAVDAAFSVGLLGFSVYAGISLWRLKPGAVRLARVYLLTGAGYLIVSPLLMLLVGFPASANSDLLAAAAQSYRGLTYYAVWSAYLVVSKRVRATYTDAEFPPNKRISLTP